MAKSKVFIIIFVLAIFAMSAAIFFECHQSTAIKRIELKHGESLCVNGRLHTINNIGVMMVDGIHHSLKVTEEGQAIMKPATYILC